METRGYREPRRDSHTRQGQRQFEGQEENFERRRAGEYYEQEGSRFGQGELGGDEDWDDQRSYEMGGMRGSGQPRSGGSMRGEQGSWSGNRERNRGFEGSQRESGGSEQWGNGVRESYRTQGRQGGGYGGYEGGPSQGYQGRGYQGGSQGYQGGGWQGGLQRYQSGGYEVGSPGYTGSRDWQGGSSWDSGAGGGKRELWGGGQQGYSDTQTGRYAGKGPRNYKRSDDRIREDVCDRLSENSQIDASNIEVAVQSGEVILKGFVIERQMKRMAEDLVERLPGVKDVTNQIRVQQQGMDLSSGPEIGSMSTQKESKNANKA